MPRASPIRLRPLSWGGTTPPPSPAPPDVSPPIRRVRGDLAVRRQRLPSAPRGCPCATSLALAASCTLARVCTRLSLRPCSLSHRLSVSAAGLQVCQSVDNRPQQASGWRLKSLPPSAAGLQVCQSVDNRHLMRLKSLPPACACGSARRAERTARGRRPARRPRGPHGRENGWGAPGGPGGAGWATGWARTVGGKGRLIFLYSVSGGSRAAEALEPAHQREGAMPRKGEAPNRRSQAHLVMLCTG
jgi:hypothetical protein